MDLSVVLQAIRLKNVQISSFSLSTGSMNMSNKTFNLRIQYEADSDDVIEQLSICDVNMKVLRRFCEYINELEALNLAYSKLSSSMNLHAERDKSGKYRIAFRTDLPDPHSFRLFTDAIRPFILESENTYFYRILGMIRKSSESSRLRMVLKQLSKAFKNAGFPRIQLKAGGDAYNHENTLKLWMNAYRFHRDEDKRVLLESFQEIVPREMLDYFFMSMLVAKGQTIRNLDLLVQAILSDGAEAIDASAIFAPSNNLENESGLS